MRSGCLAEVPGPGRLLTTRRCLQKESGSRCVWGGGGRTVYVQVYVYTENLHVHAVHIVHCLIPSPLPSPSPYPSSVPPGS